MPAKVNKPILEATIDDAINYAKSQSDEYQFDVAIVDGHVVQLKVMSIAKWKEETGVSDLVIGLVSKADLGIKQK